jgi:O-antigen/teichoic acid export membrane protein
MRRERFHASDASPADATVRQVRGGTLLLLGRILAAAGNLLVHLIIVRHLAIRDYGAFAFALAAVALGSNFAVLGLNKTVPRFVAIYEHGRDWQRVAGVLALWIGTVAVVSSAIAAAYVFLGGTISSTFLSDERYVGLLSVMVVLIPLYALDSVFLGIFATFANPRAIFLRRHVLAPGLLIAVAVLTLVVDGDVYFVAAGFVVAGAVGLAVSGAAVWRLLRGHGYQVSGLSRQHMPIRELLMFNFPLLSSELVYTLHSSLIVVGLGLVAGPAQVAAFRAIVPLAKMNELIYDSFTMLYTPIAARLFARHDLPGLRYLYWRTATWVIVLTFPIFLATFGLAEPVTRLLLGEAYRGSASILAISAAGYYFSSAVGYNGPTLRVLGRVRYLATTDLLVVAISAPAAFLLMVWLGAAGAGLSLCGILVLQNVLYQVGLRRALDVSLNRQTVMLFAMAYATGLILFAAQQMLSLPGPVAIGLGAGLAVLFMMANHRSLDLASVFPEAKTVPVLRWLFR